MTDLATDPLPGPVAVVDRLGRPLRDLRLSVTDRCNLRCTYCMPETDYEWLPRSDLLDFDELTALVDAFTGLGVRKVRITGGEPLLRRDLPDLVARIAALAGVDDLALTTNGTLLAAAAATCGPPGSAGSRSASTRWIPLAIEPSPDRDNHEAVLAGISALAVVGFEGMKINVVVQRGVNDDEVADLVRFGTEHRAEVRFIEYMDVGGATRWDAGLVVPAVELLDRLGEQLGPIVDEPVRASAPARRYRTADGTTFGIVASTTTPFCSTCDRSRVTADGRWYHCLYAPDGTDLRAPIRAGVGRDGLRDLLAAGWTDRRDQGAVDRLALADARSATPVEVTRRDPHREMHTRGG